MIPDLISWELLGPLGLYQKKHPAHFVYRRRCPQILTPEKIQKFEAYTNSVLVFDLIIFIFAMVLAAVDWDKKTC